MAMVTRSVLSAHTRKAVLFVVQAEDEIMNPWPALHSRKEPDHVAEQLLRHAKRLTLLQSPLAHPVDRL